MEKKELIKSESQEMSVVPVTGGIFFDAQAFDLAQRVAKVFSSSTMVPDHFKNNVGNCLIALNLASRMRCDPFMLLQNMYIVHGKPGIEAKLAIALVNASGKFSPIQYKFNEEKTECYAYATRTATNEVCKGVRVSIQMAKDEGWMGKPGSKWKTMPELMLQYRAAMFFARAYCPESLFGMQSKEELVDVYDLSPGPSGYELAKSGDTAPPQNGKYADMISATDRDVGKTQDPDPEPETVAGEVPDGNGNLPFDAKEHVVSDDKWGMPEWVHESPRLDEFLSACAKHWGKKIPEIKAEAQ